MLTSRARMTTRVLKRCKMGCIMGYYPPNYWLVGSAQSCLLPVLIAYRSKGYPTTAIYTFLWLASSYYHSTYSKTAYYIDQVSLWIAFVRSFVDGYNTYPYGFLCAVAANGYNYYMYFYAKHCFHSDLRIATAAHATMHIFSAIALSIQMLLSV